MEVVHAHGIDVAYQRIGTGPPVVLAHGAALDSRMWDPQTSALSDEFTVVAWDEPGYGQSSDLPATFGLADYAACLAAVIESVGLGAAHVAGLSWGGSVVLELYRLRPDLVATLILADAYAGWKGSLSEDELRIRVDGVNRMFVVPAEEFDPTLPGLFAGERPTAFVPILDAMAADVRPESLHLELDIQVDTDLRDLLPRVAVPTLLIWGELDERSPLGIAHQFADNIPDATLVVIPEAGHVSNLQQPQQFNDAVRTFCRAHPPSF